MQPARVPERPSLDGLEERWSPFWDREGTYRFDRTRPRSEIYSIDTPPPTVSGSLHVGHVFSFTQTDIVARYQRMTGKTVFYPIGWDDNGLATERRVQEHFGVRCDPSLPYEPELRLARDRDGARASGRGREGAPIAVPRPNFLELCTALVAEDEQAFEQLFRRLGTSFDWSQHYTTVSGRARRVSQRAFLRLLDRKQAYRSEAPTLWDVDFRTAVAQAELVDREEEGRYARVRFGARETGAGVEIETTRPELIAACVALVAHPDDPRFAGLFGSQVLSPLFRVPVPVLAHPLAEPDKGSGIAMVCTFGDLTDVVWWRELKLPVRSVVGRDGRMEHAAFDSEQWPSLDPASAALAYAELEGLSAKQARARTVELLRASGELVGELRTVTHSVKYYERGRRPLEIVTSAQWYIATLAHRSELLGLGRELDWHPPHMLARYESWVEGLNGDWNISRQRYFGVPFPVWYRLDDNGAPIEEDLLIPGEDRLPVDPSVDVPDGFSESQRGTPGGFVGDPDVMDTWATSSLTPQIAGKWEDDPDLFSRIFPMDLRPQAHEIIRTWLFSTVVRSDFEHGQLPWRHAAISGWILDPDHKKLGKSVGNAITPLAYLEKYGTDAVRYWAASARLGADTVFSEEQMRVGRRLAIKILNASRFVLIQLGDRAATSDKLAPPDGPGDQVPPETGDLAPLDRAMLARLSSVVTEASGALAGYDHARALEVAETFFWAYCDDYLELVKTRGYGDANVAGTRSAHQALATSLSCLLRLFAPFMPYCTEEAWSWWQAGSVHTASWPVPEHYLDLAGPGARPELLDLASEVLVALRREKTSAKRSMRAPVARCTVTGSRDLVSLVETASQDLIDAASIARLELVALGDEHDDQPGHASGSQLVVAVELDET